MVSNVEAERAGLRRGAPSGDSPGPEVEVLSPRAVPLGAPGR